MPVKEGVLETGITDPHILSDREGHDHDEDEKDEDCDVCGELAKVARHFTLING